MRLRQPTNSVRPSETWPNHSPDPKLFMEYLFNIYYYLEKKRIIVQYQHKEIVLSKEENQNSIGPSTPKIREKLYEAMANSSSSIESFDEYDVVVVEDLSTWEFIDLSDDDCVDLDNFSLSESSDSSFLVENLADDDVISEFKGEVDPDFASPSLHISKQSLLGEFLPPNPQNKGVGMYGCDDHGRDELVNVQKHLDQDVGAGDCEDENYDDDNDEHGYEDEYDDELVPLDVRNRLGRQRIRKLGKRASPKMNKSKKLHYKYNRPGCVHGKHGLGVQYAYI